MTAGLRIVAVAMAFTGSAYAETPSWPVVKLPKYQASVDTVACRNGWGWIEAGKRSWYGPPLSRQEEAEVSAKGGCMWVPRGTKLELAYIDGPSAVVCMELKGLMEGDKSIHHVCGDTSIGDISPIK